MVDEYTSIGLRPQAALIVAWEGVPKGGAKMKCLAVNI